MNKIEKIMFDLFDECEDYNDIKDSLRDMNSNDEITDIEYDYCLEHWDEILEQWVSHK